MDQDDEGGREGSTTGRPRRADAEVLSYIRSLEQLIERSVDRLERAGLQSAGSQGPASGKGGDGSEDEEGEESGEDSLLVENLIEELSHKFASVSMDRHAAPVMEKVARLCSRTQLASLLQECHGYAYCLATNRYSSHVLQTLLSLVGPLLPLEMENGPVEDGDDDEEEEGEQGTKASLQDAAIQLAQELHSSCLPLMQDICGTHTVRALFCLLTGMPVVAEKRGRHSKHQHSIETAVAVHSGSGAGNRPSHQAAEGPPPQRVRLELYEVPDAFHMMLESIVHELSEQPLPSLHEAINHPYSGPALSLLVQAVARSEGRESLELSETGAVLGLVRQVLCWSKPDRCAEVVYAMAGEPVSSRFLEAVVWYAPQPMVRQLFSRCLQGSVLEYARDDVANFVLQALLQRTDSTEDLQTILTELAGSIQELLTSRRVGVVWRLAGACARLKKWEKRVMGLVVEAMGFSSATDRHKNGEPESVVTALLEPRVTEEGRLHVNVPGARLLSCLLRLPPSLSRGLCSAVLELPAPTLEAVAKDNVASRAVLDPLLLHAAQAGPGDDADGPPLADALARQLKGRCAELAGHPVGFHVLTKCFGCLAPAAKVAMAQELVSAESRLTGTHFGRRSLSALAIPLFKTKRPKWEAAMKQGEKKKKVLEELLSMMDGVAAEGPTAPEATGESSSSKAKAPVQQLDPFEALLLPGAAVAKGGEGEKEKKKKEKKPKKDEEGSGGGGDVDFILQAIKGSAMAEKPTKARREEAVAQGEPKKKKHKKGEGDEEEGGKKRRRAVGQAGEAGGREKRRDGADDKGGRRGEGGGGPGQERRRKEGAREEAPVEKARRLLGKRAMMSRSELLDAVAELEREEGATGAAGGRKKKKKE